MRIKVLAVILLCLVAMPVWAEMLPTSTAFFEYIGDLRIKMIDYMKSYTETYCYPETTWKRIFVQGDPDADTCAWEWGVKDIECVCVDSGRTTAPDSTIYEIYDNRCGNFLFRWNPGFDNWDAVSDSSWIRGNSAFP